MNKCYYRSGIYCYPYDDSNSITCALFYSTFADNHAIEEVCIRLDNAAAKYEIKSCNIIRNTQGSLSSFGTFLLRGIFMIKDSCILENTANTNFDWSSYSTITLSNCTIDKTTCNLNLITQNTVIKSFILGLQHMSTRNCHSEYDSAGTLTPILQAPSSTKKQMNCYTCGKFIYQCRLSDFFSFSSIFLFNFIHSDTSN